MADVATSLMQRSLVESDPEIAQAIRNEVHRQADGLELIASENFVSSAILEAAGSVMTNKYAEGYPGKRYYGGCEFVDVAESLAIARARKLFGAEHANVQPHSGAQANMAVYLTLLKPGDKVLGMNLAHGGHLTHGHPLNFSGKLYTIIPYGVRKDDERIDYDELEKIATEHKPQMIMVGASAYPRVIDFERISRVAKAVGAPMVVDMAHIASLVAAGVHPTPVPHAEFVTATTHKTLRGPRAGLILCREQYAKDLDRAVFPGVQGGPLMHIIAAKADCLKEAMEPAFAEYQRQIVANAKRLAASPLFDASWVLELLDSRHEDVRTEGLRWFRAEVLARDDVALWRRLIESPYDDVRLGLVAELEGRVAGRDGPRFESLDLGPESLRGLWAAVLLNVHRGGRAKPKVVRCISTQAAMLNTTPKARPQSVRPRSVRSRSPPPSQCNFPFQTRKQSHIRGRRSSSFPIRKC